MPANENGLVVAAKKTGSSREFLKTVEGGWVELVQLSYGAKLKRQDLVMRMQVKMATGGAAPDEMDLQMASVETTVHDFRHCIKDHNLANPQERKYNFKNPAEWLEIIDPEVAGEIDELIRKMNAFDEENFTMSPNGGPLLPQAPSPNTELQN